MAVMETGVRRSCPTSMSSLPSRASSLVVCSGSQVRICATEGQVAQRFCQDPQAMPTPAVAKKSSGSQEVGRDSQRSAGRMAARPRVQAARTAARDRVSPSASLLLPREGGRDQFAILKYTAGTVKGSDRNGCLTLAGPCLPW
jgi:hypothetical protein